jgi:fructoselysine 6-kinase
MKRIVVSVGDNCIDYYLPPIDKRFVGGNAVNVAVHMQDSGIPTSYVGVVGDDSFGEILIRKLTQKNLEVSNVQTLSGQTAQTHIRLGPYGDREFVYEHLGPQPSLLLDQKTIEYVQTHTLIHTSQLGGAERYLPIFKQKKENLLSMDYGERSTQDFIERSIKFVDIAFFSLPEEKAHLGEKTALNFFGMGPSIVVVTMGSKGSLVYNGKLFYQPAISVEVVDTLGAGDRYIGVFLAQWLQKKSIDLCMKIAAEKAAQTCTHYGAWLQENLQEIIIDYEEEDQ